MTALIIEGDYSIDRQFGKAIFERIGRALGYEVKPKSTISEDYTKEENRGELK